MGRLSGKQILVVVGQKNYNDEEFNYLNELFLEEGASVSVAAPTQEKALGRLEGFVVPHLAIADAAAADYDAAVLIGGYGAFLSLWDDTALHTLLKAMAAEGKLVAACSLAGVTLANAGLLQGKRATVFPDYNSILLLKQKGADYVNEDVVSVDNIITSNHPRHKAVLAEAVISKLKE